MRAGRGRRGRRPDGRGPATPWFTEPRAGDRAARRRRPGRARPRVGRAWSVDLDELGDQGDGVGAQPGDRQPGEGIQAEEDRLAEPQLVDAARVRRCASAQPRLAELPPETTDERDARGRLDVGREPGELVHLGLVGHDAVLAGQVGARRRPGSGRAGRRRTGPAATRSPGSTPSRRSPSSTMSTTACVVPRRDAATGEGLEHRRLGVQAGRRVTDDGVDLADHGGADQGARGDPVPRRRDGRGSRRASRRARRRRRAASRRPRRRPERGLGHRRSPGCPVAASRSTSDAGVALDRVEVDLEREVRVIERSGRATS